MELLKGMDSISFRRPPRVPSFVSEPSEAEAVTAAVHESTVAQVTGLSAEQMELRLRQLFVEIDGNTDGFISWNDYSTWSVSQSALTSDTVQFTDAVRPYGVAWDVAPSSSTTQALGAAQRTTRRGGTGGARVSYARPLGAKPLRGAFSAITAEAEAAATRGGASSQEELTFSKVGGEWLDPSGPEPTVVIQPSSTKVGMLHVPKAVLQNRLREVLGSEEALRSAVLASSAAKSSAIASTRADWLQHQGARQGHERTVRTASAYLPSDGGGGQGKGGLAGSASSSMPGGSYHSKVAFGGGSSTRGRQTSSTPRLPTVTSATGGPLPASHDPKHMHWSSFAPILRDTYVPEGFKASTADVATAHSTKAVNAEEISLLPSSMAPGVATSMLAARRLSGADSSGKSSDAAASNGVHPEWAGDSAASAVSTEARHAIERLTYLRAIDAVAKMDANSPGVEIWDAQSLTPVGILLDDLTMVEDSGSAAARGSTISNARPRVLETRAVQAIDCFSGNTGRQNRVFACTAAANNTLSLWDVGLRRRAGEVVRFPKLATFDCGTTQTTVKYWDKYGVLYAGDEQGAVTAWDMFHGVRMTHCVPHKGMVTAIQPLQELDALVVGSQDRSACVLDAMTGAVHVRHIGHRRAIVDVDYSSARRVVLTASMDHDIRIWSASVPVTILTLSEHQAPLLGVHSVQGTNEVISASMDGVVKIWDLRQPATAVHSFAVSRNDESTRLRMAELGSTRRGKGGAGGGGELDEDFSIGGLSVQGVSSARDRDSDRRDGSRSEGGAMGLQRAVKLAHRMAHGTVMRGFCVCHPSHSSIMVGYKHIQRYRQSRPAELRNVTHDDIVTAVIVDTFHASILTASGGSVFVWSILTGQLDNRLELSKDRITCMMASVEGAAFAIGTDTGELSVHAMATGHKIRSLQCHTSEVVALAALGAHLVTVARDRRVLLHEDPFTSAYASEAAPVSIICGKDFPPHMKQPSGSSKRGASGMPKSSGAAQDPKPVRSESAASSMRPHTAASIELSKLLQRPTQPSAAAHHGEIKCVAARGDIDYIASGDSSGMVLVFQASSAHCEARLPHASSVNAVLMPPHHDCLFSVDDSGSYLVWKLDTATSMHRVLAGWRHVPKWFAPAPGARVRNEDPTIAVIRKKQKALQRARRATKKADPKLLGAALALKTASGARSFDAKAMQEAVNAVADAAMKSVQPVEVVFEKKAAETAQSQYVKLLEQSNRQHARDALASVFGNSGKSLTSSSVANKGAVGEGGKRPQQSQGTSALAALSQHAVVTSLLWAGEQGGCILSQDDEGRVCKWNVTELLAAVYVESSGVRHSTPKQAFSGSSVGAGATEAPVARGTAVAVAAAAAAQARPRTLPTSTTTSSGALNQPSSSSGEAKASKGASGKAAGRFSNPYQFKAPVRAQSFRTRAAAVQQRILSAEAQKQEAVKQQRLAAVQAQSLDPYAPHVGSARVTLAGTWRGKLKSQVQSTTDEGSPNLSSSYDNVREHSSNSLQSVSVSSEVGSGAALGKGAVVRKVRTPDFKEGNSASPPNGRQHLLASTCLGSITSVATGASHLHFPTADSSTLLEAADTRLGEDVLAGEDMPVPNEYTSVGRIKLRTAVLRFFHRCPVLHHSLPTVFELPISAATLVLCEWEVTAHSDAGAGLSVLAMPGVPMHVVSAGQDRRVVAMRGSSGQAAGTLLMSGGSKRNQQWDMEVDIDALREYLLGEEIQAKLQLQQQEQARSRSEAASVTKGGAATRQTKGKAQVTARSKGSSRLSQRQSQSRQASRQGSSLRPLSRGTRHSKEVQGIMHAAVQARKMQPAASIGDSRPGMMNSLDDWPDDQRPSSAWLRQELHRVVQTPIPGDQADWSFQLPSSRDTSKEPVFNAVSDAPAPDSGLDKQLRFSQQRQLGSGAASRVAQALKELHAYDDLGTSLPR